MKFSTLSSYLQAIESLDSRLAMTEQLARLFKEANESDIRPICYLSLGMLAPKFAGFDLQLAEKMMIRVIGQVLQVDTQTVNQVFKETGDLGLAYERLAADHTGADANTLSVDTVYQKLIDIARQSGPGSQERKINQMALLMSKVDSLSGKYIVRIALKKLRLGFSEMTILDSLSWMSTSDKSLRPSLEYAYNVRTDIGQIALIFITQGLEAIEKIQPEPGTPIRPAKATPLLDIEEILKKMSGRAVLEPKYDGFRVQIHISRSDSTKDDAQPEAGLFTQEKISSVEIFSRNLDNITLMFPELVEAAQKLPVESAILDGEAIAVNTKTGEMLDFQETVKRKRKHDIDRVALEIPLKAFIFDLLYLNGRSLLKETFLTRRQALETVLSKGSSGDPLVLTEQILTSNKEQFAAFFEDMAQKNLEGVMAKKTDSEYKAGARDFTWVKYKVGMQTDMADTVDAIVMGYFKGQGKWTEFGLGKVLVGIPVDGRIVSLSKVGSGFSEESIKNMVERAKQYTVTTMPSEYEVDKELVPDVWLKPGLVIEIRADSVSRSPRYQTGLSLRFPRFIRFRDDKGVAEATTLLELQQISTG